MTRYRKYPSDPPGLGFWITTVGIALAVFILIAAVRIASGEESSTIDCGPEGKAVPLLGSNRMGCIDREPVFIKVKP